MGNMSLRRLTESPAPWCPQMLLRLPVIAFMNSGKSFNFLALHFLICKMKIFDEDTCKPLSNLGFSKNLQERKSLALSPTKTLQMSATMTIQTTWKLRKETLLIPLGKKAGFGSI